MCASVFNRQIEIKSNFICWWLVFGDHFRNALIGDRFRQTHKHITVGHSVFIRVLSSITQTSPILAIMLVRGFVTYEFTDQKTFVPVALPTLHAPVLRSSNLIAILVRILCWPPLQCITLSCTSL